ncbi:MAG: amidohydrolase family protein [Oscillospiraceae bacterium]|nr:amidohydrolase family protein [Oscillospiraceae bacterium]
MNGFAVFGNIVFSLSPNRTEMLPKHYAVCENGICSGVFPELPAKYAGIRVDDFGDMLIIPGYVDLHTHAAQYRNLGLGMGSRLLDWLEKYTFPEEAAFASEEYASSVYECFAKELRSGFTTRVCILATVHVPATLLLADIMEKTGLRCLAGKVNMDRNCPGFIREEDAAASLRDTEEWLAAQNGRFQNVSPVITPRFVPSCSRELLEGLGKTADLYKLPVQSHLSETRDEVAWVGDLHPEAKCYGEIYDRSGLLGPGSVMAHCVYLTQGDRELIKRSGAFIAHCPTSNSNLQSGVAPVCEYLAEGMNIGLGSDISGGHTLDMADVIREAISASELRAAEDKNARPLSMNEAFYMGTRGGGAFFGKVGAIEAGFEFDAVAAVDGLPPGDATLIERFEKFICSSSGADVRAKYVRGKRLF